MKYRSRTHMRKPFSRRRFLQWGTGLVCAIAAPAVVRSAHAQPKVWFGGDPFSLGVASGSPARDGFVLWTRLAPEPLSVDPMRPGGLQGDPIPVDYIIASDPHLRFVVQKGTALAEPEFGFSVHVEINGLNPGRPYWYRFVSGGAQSAVGRAVTLAAPNQSVDKLRVGFVSCSNYEQGYFSAYRHLADEDPHAVLYLGDYIYEYVDRVTPNLVRRHSDNAETVTLAAYRNRYAQYRMDPDLQKLHARAPALVTWDDHEVQNDYADMLSQTFDLPEVFLLRRAAAYQAYYEHMPLRAHARPKGPHMRIFDRYRFGNLMEISLLDNRQYRSKPACYGPPSKGRARLETNVACPERNDPLRSMLGREQEEWLFKGLAQSSVQWNVIAQSLLMAQLRQRNKENDVAFWTDDWNGYPESRKRLLRHIDDSSVKNAVVFSGDIHSYWANDLKADFDDPLAPVIATEFVGTSVSAKPPPYDVFAKLLPDNPHVRYFESRWRGYSVADFTRKDLAVRFQAVRDVLDPNTDVFTLKKFAVENGRAGAIN